MSKDINSNNIKDWPTDAEKHAEDWQKHCIETVVEDLNSDIENEGYEFEEWHIGDHIGHFAENACMYNDECKEIIDQLDYDIWSDDPMTGERANSLACAAIWALEGALYEIDIHEQIKNKLNLKKNG